MNIGSSVVVDILPDFVGYLLLCLSLDKVESSLHFLSTKMDPFNLGGGSNARFDMCRGGE